MVEMRPQREKLDCQDAASTCRRCCSPAPTRWSS